MKRTGFSKTVRAVICQRADGWCERCGMRSGTEYHHRRPRGMGGTQRPETNTASAGALLCKDCHVDVESRRRLAINQGWLVAQHHNPDEIPVLYRGDWVFLDDLGNRQPIQEVLL